MSNGTAGLSESDVVAHAELMLPEQVTVALNELAGAAREVREPTAFRYIELDPRDAAAPVAGETPSPQTSRPEASSASAASGEAPGAFSHDRSAPSSPEH